MRKTSLVVALCAAVVLVSGCAQPPQQMQQQAPSIASPTPERLFKTCLVEDKAGAKLDAALHNAEVKLGVVTNSVTVNDSAQYATQIEKLVTDKCDLIVGVGQDAADAIVAAAQLNTATTFGLIDATPTTVPSNLRTVVFQIHEASFLAGYLAAAESKTKVVGAFGALDVPTVTIYLDGYAQGVNYYNEKHPDAKVKLVGWDMEKHDGVFVQSDKDPYGDPAAGKVAAQKLVDQKADVIFAVAGDSGKGALELARAHEGTRVIWAGNDGADEFSEYRDLILTSVLKKSGNALLELIKEQQKGGATGVVSANLRNEGVGLGNLNETITQAHLDDITNLSYDIRQGKITVKSSAALG